MMREVDWKWEGQGGLLCLTRGLGLCTHLAGKKNHLVLPALVLVLGPHVLLVCLLCSSGEKEKHKHNSDERNHNSHTKTASQTRRARLIGCDGRLRRTCCLGTLKPACLLGLFCFTPSNLFWRRRWRRLVLCGHAGKKTKRGPQSPTDVHLKIKRKKCKKATTNTAGLAWGWVWLLAPCTAHLWLLFSLCTTERSARNGHECRDKERVWEKVRHSFTQQQAKKKCKSETKQKDKKKGQTQRQKSSCNWNADEKEKKSASDAIGASE